MNIIDKRVSGDHKYGMLHAGDVFVDEEGVVYMKMYHCADSEGYVFNTVNLYTGEITRFEFENMVTLVSATLTIEDIKED